MCYLNWLVLPFVQSMKWAGEWVGSPTLRWTLRFFITWTDAGCLYIRIGCTYVLLSMTDQSHLKELVYGLSPEEEQEEISKLAAPIIALGVPDSVFNRCNFYKHCYTFKCFKKLLKYVFSLNQRGILEEAINLGITYNFFTLLMYWDKWKVLESLLVFWGRKRGRNYYLVFRGKRRLRKRKWNRLLICWSKRIGLWLGHQMIRLLLIIARKLIGWSSARKLRLTRFVRRPPEMYHRMYAQTNEDCRATSDFILDFVIVLCYGNRTLKVFFLPWIDVLAMFSNFKWREHQCYNSQFYRD